MRKMLILQILFLAFVITLSFFIFRSLTKSDDYAESKDSVFHPKEVSRLPTKQDLLELEECYKEVSAFLEGKITLKDEIIELYADVTSAKVCSKANKSFTKLEECFKEYVMQLYEIQQSIATFEEKYNNYSYLLSEIPEYSVSLRNELYNEFHEKVDPMYKYVSSEKEKYLIDENEINKIYIAAKKIADDFFKEYFDLMSRLVMAEGGITSAEEQCYIANVVENRIERTDYPNTLYAVIYASGQYACVDTGTINNPASKEVLQNVENYLRGKVETGMPENVVYQARFEQGSGNWYVSPSGHYFCYK